MAVTAGFCSVCNRQVYVSEGDQLSCPVCSSPLIETASASDEDVVVTSYHPANARPEVYLG